MGNKSMGQLEEMREINEKVDEVYLMYGLLRKKENKGVTKPIVCRQIIRNWELDKKILISRMDEIKGLWRIYRTVNSRNVDKALKKLVIDYIKGEKKFADRVDTHWKTCLMQSECKNERNILVDIDSIDPDYIDDIFDELKINHVEIVDKNKTPNGFHVICKKFDTRILDKYAPNKTIGGGSVEIKRDGLFFIELYDNRDKIKCVNINNIEG